MSTKGITEKEPDPRIVYADIIDHPHHQSATRPHMSLYNRAAQFAPYVALVGFSDMISEEARTTNTKEELGENELELLNQKLSLIADVIEDGEHPELTITCFVPDKMKDGGAYVTFTDRIKKVDVISKKLVLMSTTGRAKMNMEIDIDAIAEIHGELVDYLEM